MNRLWKFFFSAAETFSLSDERYMATLPEDDRQITSWILLMENHSIPWPNRGTEMYWIIKEEDQALMTGVLGGGFIKTLAGFVYGQEYLHFANQLQNYSNQRVGNILYESAHNI